MGVGRTDSEEARTDCEQADRRRSGERRERVGGEAIEEPGQVDEREDDHREVPRDSGQVHREVGVQGQQIADARSHGDPRERDWPHRTGDDQRPGRAEQTPDVRTEQGGEDALVVHM